MIWNPFARSKPAPQAAPEPRTHEALKRTLDEQRHLHPLAGPVIVSREIVSRLLQASADGQGVHIETALSRVAALAGYSCQAAARAEYIDQQGRPEGEVFTVAEAQGRRYYFGDLLNLHLVKEPYSVWGLSNGMAQKLGWQGHVDLDELFDHVVVTVGEPDFGQPRLPEGHGIAEPPLESLKALWPAVLPLLKDCCAGPLEWPITCGLAIQQLMEQAKAVLDPGVALRIVMECAVPMSKVDLDAASL